MSVFKGAACHYERFVASRGLGRGKIFLFTGVLIRASRTRRRSGRGTVEKKTSSLGVVCMYPYLRYVRIRMLLMTKRQDVLIGKLVLDRLLSSRSGGDMIRS